MPFFLLNTLSFSKNFQKKEVGACSHYFLHVKKILSEDLSGLL